MKRTLVLIAFAVLAIAQWAAPASMIRQHELTLSQGAVFKIRCMPIDPADPFRGRFVSINLDLGSPKMAAGQSPLAPLRAWVTLETGEDGFARWGQVHAERPESGAYVQTEVWQGWDADTEALMADPPLDRFYMNEWRAPEAELAYFEAMRTDPLECYVVARVRNGMMVLEALYLDGQPIAEYLQQREAPAQ